MNVLVIAPHPDDEILGVGGTIAKMIAEKNDVFVCVVTKGYEPLFSINQVNMVREECELAHKLLGIKKTYFLDFPAAMLEDVPRYKLNDAFVKIIQEIKPEEVYLPHIGDMQIDHQIVVDSAMVALRPRYEHIVSRIYAYETLSETGWNIPNTMNEFIPTVYNDISEYIDIKIKALDLFKSQISDYPNARSLQAVEALAMLRGSTVNVCAAEAFSLIREIKYKRG